jgi:hypothetical protein
MAKQEIRQALNKIDITGVIKEHKLASGKSDEGKYINGSIVIKAGEFTEVTVKVFVTETNSKGKTKKAYENLEKILKGEIKTMVEVSEEDAVKVRLWGNEGFTPQFREEIFKPENATEVVTKIGVDLGFGNITIDNKITPEDYKATFDIEMFVESVEEEIDKNDEETGRVIVKGWCPVYGGSVIPLELKAGIVVDDDGEYDFAEDVRNSIDPETTVNFWGDINFKAIVEKVLKGGSLGRAKVDEKRTYIHDLIAIGADFVEEDNEYDIEDIKQARIERENKKQEAENKAENKEDKSNKSSGIAGRRAASRNNKADKSARTNRTNKTSNPVNDKPNTDDDDDLPF